MIPYSWTTLGRALKLTFTRRYFSLRYLAFFLLIFVLHSLFLLLAQAMRMLDPLLFPDYRKVEPKTSIYILANPRSGTTFLHRLMCLDEQFEYFKLWQNLFPSILMYKFWGGVAAVDAALGGPLKGILRGINRLMFGGWEGIHAVGLERAEEDEALWVFSLLTPAVMLLFPFMSQLGVEFVDHMDANLRTRLAHYFRDTLQRHLYATNPNKLFLAKNVFATGRMRVYLEATPDLKIVHLVRHPYEAIPSLLSMFTLPWRAHSPQLVGDTPETHALVDMAIAYYRHLLELKAEMPPDRFVEIHYDELIANPEAVVHKIYATLNLTMSDTYAAALKAECERAREYRSVHAYDLAHYGLSKQAIYARCQDVFAAYGFEP